MPRVGDIWIPMETAIRNCCSQLYRPELDDRIKEGNCILKISNSSKDFHMFSQLYCNDLYGCFFQRYASRRDMDYNIRVGNNRLQCVEYEEKKNEVEIGNQNIDQVYLLKTFNRQVWRSSFRAKTWRMFLIRQKVFKWLRKSENWMKVFSKLPNSI